MVSKDTQRANAVLGRCPICKAPVDMAYRPFCSARCRDVDLSRWLRGTYAIPGGERTADEEGPAERDGPPDRADADDE
jgi:endogenous inhibitor of DNA gyrase (YacG/DUF329 family)